MNRLSSLLLSGLIAAMFCATLAAAEADFGMVTIQRSEIARLGAFCLDEAVGDTLPTPCDVVFEFHDQGGRVLKQARMRLQPGAGGFLDLPGSEAGRIAPCGRVERGAVVVSLQIFEPGTHRPNVLVNWADRPRARSGESEFGLVNLTRFDTARLSASCEADAPPGTIPQPCDVVFELHDLSGRVLRQASMTLLPGTSGFLDLNGLEAGVVGPCGKIGRGMALINFALIDNSGRTNVLVYPAAVLTAAGPQ